jgi:hypothetical protein
MQRFLDLFISINCSACFRRFLRLSSGEQNCTYSVRYCQSNTAACCYRGWDGIAAGSRIGLTIPDAVCTVMCSWWWAEEPPETCRAIYRNKYIEKTLHLVGCTLELLTVCFYQAIGGRVDKTMFTIFFSGFHTINYVTSFPVSHTHLNTVMPNKLFCHFF